MTAPAPQLLLFRLDLLQVTSWHLHCTLSAVLLLYKQSSVGRWPAVQAEWGRPGAWGGELIINTSSLDPLLFHPNSRQPFLNGRQHQLWMDQEAREMEYHYLWIIWYLFTSFFSSPVDDIGHFDKSSSWAGSLRCGARRNRGESPLVLSPDTLTSWTKYLLYSYKSNIFQSEKIFINFS